MCTLTPRAQHTGCAGQVSNELQGSIIYVKIRREERRELKANEEEAL